MDLVEATNYYLQERNPHLDSYQSTRDMAKKYKGDEYSIRFVDSWIEYQGKKDFKYTSKVGVNPQKGWNNPRGVYSYWIDDYNRGTNASYAVKSDTAYILKRDPAVGNQIVDIGRLSRNDYVNIYLPALKKFYEEDIECETLRKDYGDFINFIKDVEDKSHNKSVGGILFYAVVKIGEESQNRQSDALQTHIWRSVLGVTFIGDKGHGIIHPNEASQCLFLDPKAYEVVDQADNTKNYAAAKGKATERDLYAVLAKMGDYKTPPTAEKIISIIDEYVRQGAEIDSRVGSTISTLYGIFMRRNLNQNFDYKTSIQKVFDHLKKKYDIDPMEMDKKRWGIE